VFPERYELNLYIFLIRNSVFKGLTHISGLHAALVPQVEQL
jgi:hypothetical protein